MVTLAGFAVTFTNRQTWVRVCRKALSWDLFFLTCSLTPHDCLVLQSDINSASDWCSPNSTRFNVAKTRVMSYPRKTNILSYEYQLCHVAITHTSRFKDLRVFFDSKLYFHNLVDFIFSECMKLLGLIRTISFRFSSLYCLYVLYFTLVRYKLQCASVIRNSITSTDANKREHIQQKFASVCVYHFFPHVPYSYIFSQRN
jgi:hypothetical protein